MKILVCCRPLALPALAAAVLFTTCGLGVAGAGHREGTPLQMIGGRHGSRDLVEGFFALPRSPRILAVMAPGTRAWIVDARTYIVVQSLPLGAAIGTLVFAPSGSFAASESPAGGAVTIWRTRTWTPARRLAAEWDSRLDYLRNGTLVAIGERRSIAVGNNGLGSVRSIPARFDPAASAWSAAASPVADALILGGRGMLTLWDTRTWTASKRILLSSIGIAGGRVDGPVAAVRPDWISLLQYSPDGKSLLVSCDRSTELIAVDTRTWTEKFAISDPQMDGDSAFNDANFSPDGSEFVTYNHTEMQFWASKDGRLALEVGPNLWPWGFTAASYCVGSDVVATGHEGGFVAFWRAPAVGRQSKRCVHAGRRRSVVASAARLMQDLLAAGPKKQKSVSFGVISLALSLATCLALPFGLGSVNT